jgi:hypothetical protein
MGTQGSVEFMFDHTCNFRIRWIDAEELELELSILVLKKFWRWRWNFNLCPFQALEPSKRIIRNASMKFFLLVLRIPQITKVTEAEMDVEKLIEN